MPVEAATLLTALAALVAVMALIGLAAWVVRLFGFATRPAGGGRLLAVEDVLTIDARRRLHVVRCERRRVLLLTGGAQDVVVGWLDPTPPEAE